MNRDELVLSRIEDRISQCRDGWYVTSTGFLDTHEQALADTAMKRARDVRTFLYGGYEGAERRMLVCVPADLPMEDSEACDGLITVLRVTKEKGSRELTHRDYLGSLLGLGIDRSVSGDILVRDDGADILIVPEMAEFLINEYRQAGRTSIRAERVPLSGLIIPEAGIQTISDTVSSTRLDSIVSSAFRLSRAKAADAIRGGIVSVDHMECLKPDARVPEGAVIVLRGKGKAVLRETGAETRKGRIRIKIDRYI